MAKELPRYVDTVIIGNGPSALILSYILHGWIPYYIGGHYDSILDAKLQERTCLLDLTPDLYAHFQASLRYSTQALPVNTLLDTLLRPNADTEINPTSCIEWRFEPERAIEHVAIGQTARPGGQWAEDTIEASRDIGTLSYAEQLSLPGYTYSDHVKRAGTEGQQCDFVRPSRKQVAEYLEAYPQAVGIADAIYTATEVKDVRRTSSGGFEIGNLGVRCKHLVLASGIFTVNLPPPPLLEPVSRLEDTREPLLVIGSGFSAADVIISAATDRKIIHIFQWAPESRASPLRGCHHTAYPEYATVYRQMKLSTINNSKALAAKSPMLRRKSNPFFTQRDWTSLYEGLPNAEILSVAMAPDSTSASVEIRTSSGDIITRRVGGLEYVVGRRGTLDYLSPPLRVSVLDGAATTQAPHPQSTSIISGRTLRSKAESTLEVSPNVFIIGSLAGDSLIRHAVGGCVYAAGRILDAIPTSLSSHPSPTLLPCSSTETPTTTTASSSHKADSDAGGSTSPTTTEASCASQHSAAVLTNGHSDLHLDRRKLARAVEQASEQNRAWVETGWWAGGGSVGGWPGTLN
ncbi:hypothetical protein BU24DRAFT_436403 [Aaosphaeria arxii CBS 175.79]|uniref:FAD/NAD(P)-binding domain-containing protein n=1 Tax=Aaosphaeria arxii CBS 175.79 TaxID=1450172 RepID=A0A6A5XE32_9PLEO|nr:uncharacterized protein BU24DRAFT_436403 [Aaosphaeria arxii CBS 175.79]KAF2011123.1 hypothetical protein BU24DRAFT_436403 [Aaosphaeria arxii CBS 175.79]